MIIYTNQQINTIFWCHQLLSPKLWLLWPKELYPSEPLGDNSLHISGNLSLLSNANVTLPKTSPNRPNVIHLLLRKRNWKQKKISADRKSKKIPFRQGRPLLCRARFIASALGARILRDRCQQHTEEHFFERWAATGIRNLRRCSQQEVIGATEWIEREYGTS